MPLTTPAQLAESCAVSPRTVARWLKAGDLPGGSTGPWDADAVNAWKKAKRSAAGRKRRAARDPAEGTPKHAADVRYRVVKAEIAEVKLRQLRGDLVERSAVEDMLVSRLVELRKDLQGLGRALSSPLQGKSPSEAQQIIDARIRKILVNFVTKRGLEDLT